MPTAVPTLTDGLAHVMGEALNDCADKLLRVEDLQGVDVDLLLGIIDSQSAYRFAFVSPYLKHPVSRRKNVVRDPRVATRWRNEPLSTRSRSPVVIFGTATGREESGLKKVRTIIRPPIVLKHYENLLLDF